MKKNIKSLFALSNFANLLQKQVVALLLIVCTGFSFVQAASSSVFIQSTQSIKGFGGLATANNGKLFVCGQPKNLRIFNPVSGLFEGNQYILTDYSFSDDVAVIPTNIGAGIPGGLALASFLDGRIPTVLNNSTVVQSNAGLFTVVPTTGIFMATENAELLGIDPLTYRISNDRLYAQGFDPTVIYRVDWRGSVPAPVTLSVPTALNAFQFGPNDLLYAPDVPNNKIVSIDADTGVVTDVVLNIPTPIAVKVDSTGILYFIGRRTGNVYRYNIGTTTLTTLATLEPALDNLTLNEAIRKLYVSNDENKIFEVDMDTGANRILFQSPIVQPWDIAFDPETTSLYVADFGSIKQFNSNNAMLQRILILDTTTSGLEGQGQASGITVEEGPNAKIVITDITLGNIMVINKSDFAVYDILSTFETGLFEKQPFSTVRVTNGTPNEYYLSTNAVDGTILKIYRVAGVITTETFFSGLHSPVKLKLNGDYLYVVEAGRLNEGIPNSGRISRILLNNPTSQEILVDNLSNPQGFDIFEDTIAFAEVGTGKLFSASAIAPSTPTQIFSGLSFSNDLLISQFNPIPIDPFAGIAIGKHGKTVYVNQTQPDNILKVKTKL